MMTYDNDNSLYHFNLFQEEAINFAVYPDQGDNLYYPALGLAGEAGEVCEKIKKVMRDKDGVLTTEDRLEIKKEIGDVLWYVSALAYELDLELSNVAEAVLIKLRDRAHRNVIKGSGDNR